MITQKWDDHMMKRLWSPTPLCAILQYYPTIQNGFNDGNGDDDQMITWWLLQNEMIIRWKDFYRQLPCVQYHPTIQMVGRKISLFVHFPCKFESFVGSTLHCTIVGSTVQRVISVPQTTLNSTCLRKVCIVYGVLLMYTCVSKDMCAHRLLVIMNTHKS